MSINHVARTGFGREAQTYERVRPSYPQAALDAVATTFGIGIGSRVLDLAAGTGKLTRQLVMTGATVVAAEPIDAMRDVLGAVLPDVGAVAAVAEGLPFAAASFDLIAVGQGFHWFDAKPALDEAARVLRPGGGLALLWNERDDEGGWEKELDDLLHEAVERPYSEDIDHGEVVGAHPAFADAHWEHFAWREPIDRERLLDLVRSRSYVAAMDEAERAPILAAVLDIVRDLPEQFELPYSTDVVLARRSAP